MYVYNNIKTMKTTRYLFFVLLLSLTGIAAQAQTRNELVLPDYRFWADEIKMPVQLENTDEVVAMQFDLHVPLYVSVYADTLSNSRKADHELSVNYLRYENDE